MGYARITIPKGRIAQFCRRWRIKDALRNPFRRRSILRGAEVVYAACL